MELKLENLAVADAWWKAECVYFADTNFAVTDGVDEAKSSFRSF